MLVNSTFDQYGARELDDFLFSRVRPVNKLKVKIEVTLYH